MDLEKVASLPLVLEEVAFPLLKQRDRGKIVQMGQLFICRSREERMPPMDDGQPRHWFFKNYLILKCMQETDP